MSERAEELKKQWIPCQARDDKRKLKGSVIPSRATHSVGNSDAESRKTKIMTKRFKNIQIETLSKEWATLERVTFDYHISDGRWVQQTRESYNRGDGATILLYNKEKQTVILTKQIRIPTYFNGNEDGFVIEACAGMLDKDHPEECIIREVEEETGYRIPKAEKVFELFSTPGAVTEKLYYFLGAYDDSMKVSAGGGLDEENEDIEVLELPFKKALEMMYSGEIEDAKTVILLQNLIIRNLF